MCRFMVVMLNTRGPITFIHNALMIRTSANQIATMELSHN